VTDRERAASPASTTPFESASRRHGDSRLKDSKTVSAAVSVRGKSKSNPKLRQGPGRPTLTNEELLDKALDLFLEKGFERTTIDAITASAGMAKRTVYLRYSDKTALFKAALQRAIEDWIVPVERLRAAESDDVEETLLRVGQILLENLVACGPATMAAWGVVLDNAAIDRHTQYCVRLFLYGLLPREASGATPRIANGRAQTGRGHAERDMSRPEHWEALQIENRRLRKLLLDSMLQVAALKERQGS
jgi:AcrR family transcriptional regulator